MKGKAEGKGDEAAEQMRGMKGQTGGKRCKHGR